VRERAVVKGARENKGRNPVETIIRLLTDSSFYTKRITLLLVDTFMLAFSLWAAVAMRLETFWPVLWERCSWLFFVQPLISLPIFIRLGLYRAVIRYTSFDALWVICQAVIGSVLVLVALLLLASLSEIPRSTPLIFSVLAFFFIGGSRLLFRDLYFRFCNPKRHARRVLIYGAGSSGTQMITAFQMSSEFDPVALVDDEKTLQGRRLNGILIYPPSRISDLVKDLAVDLILLAMPSAPRKRIREILRFLEPLPVEVKSLPYLDVLVSKELGIKSIKDIEIEDLLGRDPVPARMDLIYSSIKGKSVLVTGAGGSIGSELCRQIAKLEPNCLVLFEQSEFALYTIEAELRSCFGGSLLIYPVLGSVCHERRVLSVIKAFQIQSVYHAAAYKHVPLVEYNPIEGVQNNLIGTLRMARAAIKAQVETFILISTDKAVRPANVMGASKRMAEMVLQALAAKGPGKPRFTMVRFGNVLGSSGSVVPLFREQIRNGGPVTVTHPEVVRYFMTIPEAVQLVVQAAAMGTGGDVFVLDMGEPVHIVDLARKMIRLCGRTVRNDQNPNGEIAIEFTGLRAGEKLYEELLVGGNVVGTEHPMIMRAEESFIPWERLEKILVQVERACKEFDHQAVRSILLETVDGYCPQCEIVDPVWKNDQQENALDGFGGKVALLRGHGDMGTRGR